MCTQGVWVELDKKKQVLLYGVYRTWKGLWRYVGASRAVGIVTPSGEHHITAESTRER
jgi:hypothetical protein